MKKGWYPDPKDSEQYRWWNGQSWTEDTRSLEEAKRFLQDEGEEIELEQGAREAIERRRQALHQAGKRFTEEGIRSRRSQRADTDLSAPEDKPESPPSFEEEVPSEAPSFQDFDATTDPQSFPDIENAPQASTEFPDFFEETPASEDNDIPEKPPSQSPKAPRASRSKRPRVSSKKKHKAKSSQEKSPRKIKKPVGAVLRGGKEAVRAASLIAQEAVRPLRKDRKEEEDLVPSSTGFSTRRLLIVTIPVAFVIILAGALVLLPGDSTEPRKDLVVGKPETEAPAQQEKPRRDPEQVRQQRIDQCIESSPAVNSFVREDVSGEATWKIIFVDDNYELVTVTEKDTPAAAKQEAELSATSFVASAGGKFIVLGPLRGIEGSGIEASRQILRYINSLSGCLARIK